MEKDILLDKLDRAIADKRKELEQLREIVALQQRAAELAAAELRALELAAQMRPLANGQSEPSGRKGRQPGALSKEWRGVLRAMHLQGGRFSYGAIGVLAGNQGIAATPSGVRERVRTFLDKGFLDGSPPDGFVVTLLAAERFELSNEQPLGLNDPATAAMFQ